MSSAAFGRRGFLAGAAATGGLLAMPGIARAQSYARGPVHIIVQNAAGGSNDALARFIAPGMEDFLGVPVVVENRPGAAGNIGFNAVLQARPDGQTVLCSSAAILAAAHTSDNSPGNPVTDLEHISIIADGPFRCVINSENGIDGYEALAAYLKENPGAYRHGTPGFGGNIHLLAEIFKNRAGITMPAVHYNALGNIMTDLLANEIQVGITGPHHTADYIREGQLTPLFTTGIEREEAFPEIPTSQELGLADVEKFRNWFGLHAPKGTDPEIVAALYEASSHALSDEKVVESIRANNFKVGGITPDEFAEVMVSEDAVYAEAAALIRD